MHLLCADTCYRALAARDDRFDGLFFVAVKTTGIYCRPVCRARTPARDRCVFYRRAAEAEQAGFRACFRCRPELAPGGAPQDAVPRLVRRAVARIEAGALNERSVDDLAAELGVGPRHLRRAIQAELGISPVALAQSRRLALAKQLLQDSTLPITEVAYAAGFASLRRFHAAFRARFGVPPTALRRRQEGADDHVALRLDYRPPLDWEALLRFLAARAAPGVESVRDGTYRRTVAIGGRRGVIAVRPDGEGAALRVEVSLSLAGALFPLAARLRRLFDLDARPDVIAACLGQSPVLAPLLRARPGLRVPGAMDGFEAAARAIVGQQVSVRAATTIWGRLVAALGERIETGETGETALRLLAPTAEAVLGAGAGALRAVGLTAARAEALLHLSRAVAEGGLRLASGPGADEDPEETVRRLIALPGIGDWTANYIALRALGWPDALPAGDLVLRQALGVGSAAQVRALAEPWRPWRAYATLHLWAAAATDE